MWVQAPDGAWIEFDDNATDADIEEAMKPAAQPDAPEQPRLNIPDPDAWMKDPRVQQEAASAVQAVSPAPPPAGTTGERRGSLLPISHSYVTDETGQMHDTGTNWAVPGILADVPQQVEALGSHPLGTEYSDQDIGALLGLSGFGVRPFGAEVPTSPIAKPSGMMEDFTTSVARRQSLEKGKAKAEIVREEADRVRQEYAGHLTVSEQKALDDIVARGAGPVRSAVESYAGRKGVGVGFDPGSAIFTGTSLISAGPGTGAKIAAARAAVGLADKASILGARAARGMLTRKDIRDIGDVLKSKGGPVSTSGGKSAYSGTTVSRIEPKPVKPVPVKTGPIKPVAKSAETLSAPPSPKGVLSAPTSKTTSVKLKSEEQRLMEEYMAEGGKVTKATPPAAKTGIVVPERPVKPASPKSVLSQPKTGRPPTLSEAIETTPEVKTTPKQPRSVVAKPAEPVTTPKEPRVAKKAEARQARKAEKAGNVAAEEPAVGGSDANIQKMREILAKKAKRGRGSY